MEYQTPQTPEELKFAESVEKLSPLLKTLNDLMASGRLSLKNQQYRIENNHLTILSQEKKIAENQTLIDATNKRAAGIISMAEEKAREIDVNIKAKLAQANHIEREAGEKLAKADKLLWVTEDKKKVKV